MVATKYLLDNQKALVQPQRTSKLYWFLLLVLGFCFIWVTYTYLNLPSDSDSEPSFHRDSKAVSFLHFFSGRTNQSLTNQTSPEPTHDGILSSGTRIKDIDREDQGENSLGLKDQGPNSLDQGDQAHNALNQKDQAHKSLDHKVHQDNSLDQDHNSFGKDDQHSLEDEPTTVLPEDKFSLFVRIRAKIHSNVKKFRQIHANNYHNGLLEALNATKAKADTNDPDKDRLGETEPKAVDTNDEIRNKAKSDEKTNDKDNEFSDKDRFVDTEFNFNDKDGFIDHFPSHTERAGKDQYLDKADKDKSIGDKDKSIEDQFRDIVDELALDKDTINEILATDKDINENLALDRATKQKLASDKVTSEKIANVDEDVNYGVCHRNVPDKERFDCFPNGQVTEESCTARGCCWSISNNSKVPACFYPHGLQSYKVVHIDKHSYGLDVYWKNTIKSPYGSDVQMLQMSVKFETVQRLHVKITDANATRYEPSFPEVPMFNNRVKSVDCLYDVSVAENGTGFAVTRRSDQAIVFDSRNLGGFMYSNQFIQISSRLSSPYIYGLGEHRNQFLLDTDWKTIVLWPLDGPPQDGVNGYGYHPFYLNLNASSGLAHGVFLRTSNALEIVLQPTPAITYRVLGGILDFYYFLGPKPGDVISQYLDLIGYPELPPYWSLGFHLCRYGYKNLSHIQSVVDRNVKAGIPLDTVWIDIDYMERHNNFDLHKEGRHFIPILDPGVASREDSNYLPYVEGVEKGIFVMNSSGLPAEGKVWNDKGGTVFPDFSHPDATEYWLRQLQYLYAQFEFDGLWIDMNEPSNFVDGTLQGCPTNSTYEFPPYTPHVQGGSLNHRTLCMESRHWGGELHYNLHTMYGTMETLATSFALKEIHNARSIVISRSTYTGQGKYGGHWTGDVFSTYDDMKHSVAGQGKYGGHWTGDVFSTYDDMKHSVADIMSFSMFGIPMVGADICGFNGDTTPDLCQRWSQLGAFYPFSRNHNEDEAKVSSTGLAIGSSDIVTSIVTAYRVRYSLLPYLYSLFYRATLYGETVARPLLFEYPGDHNTYSISTQFMWGPGLLISPVLEKDQTFTETYLPRGYWYGYYTLLRINSTGESYSIPAPKSTIPFRKNPMYLWVALDEAGKATGILYWDDGESLNTWENKQVTVVEFRVTNQSLISNVTQTGYTKEPMKLDYITVLGVETGVTKVWSNGSPHTQFKLTKQVLNVTELNLDLTKPFNITWT
ncbi:hypothetical protein M8J76_001346 [Diaphorina citri]|nr:hypothetical protein M8J76_001346 [Diaphorina citri]